MQNRLANESGQPSEESTSVKTATLPLPAVQAPVRNNECHQAVSAPKREASGPRLTVTDLTTATPSFRERRVGQESSRESFDRSPLVRTVNTVFSALGKVSRGIPVPNRESGVLEIIEFPHYQKVWDLNDPTRQSLNIRNAIREGKFTSHGFYSHLGQAVALPVAVGFRDLARSLQPARVADHLRRREVQEYQALNRVSPHGDRSGRLVIEPVIFHSGAGRCEVYGFHNRATNQYLVVNPQGDRVELIREVSFSVQKDPSRPRDRGEVVRLLNGKSVRDTFPFSEPEKDGPAMVAALEKQGFRPLYAVPSMRADLPEGAPREKGAQIMAIESLLRSAHSAGTTIPTAMEVLKGNSSAVDNLDNPVERDMVQGWVTLAESLRISGLHDGAVTRTLAAIQRNMVALGNLDDQFQKALQSDGGHRDPAYAIKDFLTKRFAITETTEGIGSRDVSIDNLRNLLFDRSPEMSALTKGEDLFGAASRDVNLNRYNQIESIHRELQVLLPEIVVRDAKGKPMRAPELVPDPKNPTKTIQRQASWSDGSPRYASELDPILNEAFQHLSPVLEASNSLDLSLRNTRANLKALQAGWMHSANPHQITEAIRNRYVDLVLKEANQQEISPEDLRWMRDLENTFAKSHPAFTDLIGTYVEGVAVAPDLAKIGLMELQRSGFAVGRILDGMDRKNPLNAYPVGTYSMPPFPSKKVVVLPDSKECARFSAFILKRKIDGDFMGSLEMCPMESGMDLNRAMVFMREQSLSNARVAYTSTPPSEFILPRDARGFPVLREGVQAERVYSQQEMIAHAMRWPIVEVADPHASGSRARMALVGCVVDQQRGPGAALVRPGFYVPIYTLREEDPSSKANILPRTFSGLPPQMDEIAFTKANPCQAQVLGTLQKALPQENSNQIRRIVNGLYERGGRYIYPDLSFEEGIKAFKATRIATVEAMATFERVKAQVFSSAIPGAGTRSEVGLKIQADLEGKLAHIQADLVARKTGINLVVKAFLEQLARYGTNPVRSFVSLRADGSSTWEQNPVLAWESNQAMVEGPGSLTSLQRKGYSFRLETARLDG